ncbi:hypothetical protein [Flavobacterium gilvum]|nr:hypothetical protein [Flavobacterium gilvum]
MKKELLLALLIGMFFISCSKSEDSENTNQLANFKNSSNVLRFEYDNTDDGIENFIEPAQQQDWHAVYVIEYKGAEKKVLVSTLNGDSVLVLSEQFDVDSVKNGDIICHNKDNSTIFRYISLTEVHQIVKTTNGYKKTKYIMRK